jgi:hypothetical protein
MHYRILLQSPHPDANERHIRPPKIGPITSELVGVFNQATESKMRACTQQSRAFGNTTYQQMSYSTTKPEPLAFLIKEEE